MKETNKMKNAVGTILQKKKKRFITTGSIGNEKQMNLTRLFCF